MSGILLLFFALACTAPTQPQEAQPNYQVTFLKEVDTIFVDMDGGQVTKYLAATTNIRDRKMAIISSDVYIQATAGFGHIDTVSTVNGISYTNNGRIGTAFGAFPNMAGKTATIIVKVIDDVRDVDEYKNLNLRRVLAVDTMKVVVLSRR